MEKHSTLHINKRVSHMYQKNELKKLTIYYAEGYILFTSHLWCEINLHSESNHTCVFIEGESPIEYALNLATFEAESSYEKKTKVFECSVPKKEIEYFLEKVFFDYDVRILGDKAFETHPSAHYDYINNSIYIDEMIDRLVVELETVDGVVDRVEMKRFSIGGKILLSHIKQCKILGGIFII